MALKIGAAARLRLSARLKAGRELFRTLMPSFPDSKARLQPEETHGYHLEFRTAMLSKVGAWLKEMDFKPLPVGAYPGLKGRAFKKGTMVLLVEVQDNCGTLIIDSI